MHFTNKGSFVPYNYLDPLNFESLLSEEEKIIMDNAKNYAQSKLMPRILDANRKHFFNKEIMREMGKMGCLLLIFINF